MKYKVTLAVIPITCLLISSIHITGVNAGTARMFSYNDAHYGTKVQYPSDWKFSIDGGEPTFFPPESDPSEQYLASVWFSKRNLNESTGIGYYLNYSKDYYNSLPGIQVVKAISNVTLGGNPAYMLEWITTDEYARRYNTMKIGTIIGTEEYYITYYATAEKYDHYLPVVQKMISSFRIELPEKNIPYVTIKPQIWSNDMLDVYVVVEPKSKVVSSKFVQDAINAINKWSELLKKYSNNSNAWNFDIHVKTESLSQNERFQFGDRFNPPADIIIELKANTEREDCSKLRGESIAPIDISRFSVYSYAFTLCMGVEWPHDVVYSTVLHEFGHDLGLGHTYYKDGDLMCSGEEDKHEHTVITCPLSREVKEVPSDLDIQGLIYRYGIDGFETPNKKLKGEEPRYYQKLAVGTEIDNKTKIDRLLTQGWTLDDFGKTDEAIKYFDRALAINQSDTDSLYAKGYALDSLGRYEEAVKYYDKALAIDPDDVDALYNKGGILFDLGKYQEAIRYYDRILSIDPTDSDAILKKNDTLIKLRN